jgi:hypothetical protein
MNVTKITPLPKGCLPVNKKGGWRMNLLRQPPEYFS